MPSDDKLFPFMVEVLKGDVWPVLYRRTRIRGTKTCEHEFRWKRAANSRNDELKMVYDLTPDEHARCYGLFKKACADRGMAPSVIYRDPNAPDAAA